MPRGFLPPAFPQQFPMLRPDGKLPQVFNYDFDDQKNEKKWRNPREDITDYFNYGMNEEVWKVYVEKVKKLASRVEKFNKEAPKEPTNLDHTLPLEFGGFGTPHFEEVRQLPFFNAVRNNKERFFLKCFLNDSHTADTLRTLIQEFLSKDEIVEESERLVRAAYEQVEPGLLKLGRTLPAENHYMNLKPALPPNLPLRQQIGRELKLDSRAPTQFPRVGQLNQNQVDLLAQMGYSIPGVEHKPDPKADSKSPPKEKQRPEKKPADSPKSSRSVQKHRKERDRKDRSPSLRREKKKRDVSPRSRSHPRKNKADKKKDKDKSKARSRSREKDRAADEDRGSKKKSKKEAKEKKNESRKKSKERSRNQKEKAASRSRSSNHSARKKEVHLKKPVPVPDIRQRIQTRKP